MKTAADWGLTTVYAASVVTVQVMVTCLSLTLLSSGTISRSTLVLPAGMTTKLTWEARVKRVSLPPERLRFTVSGAEVSPSRTIRNNAVLGFLGSSRATVSIPSICTLGSAACAAENSRPGINSSSHAPQRRHGLDVTALINRCACDWPGCALAGIVAMVYSTTRLVSSGRRPPGGDRTVPLPQLFAPLAATC